MKRAVLFPFLFCLYVVVIPLVNNLDQLDPFQAARPLLVILAVCVGMIVLLWLVFKDWDYAGYLILLALVFIFIPGHLQRVILDPLKVEADWTGLFLLFVVGACLVLLGLKSTWRRLGAGRRVTPLLNTILAVALLSQSILALPWLASQWTASAQEAGPDSLPHTGNTLELNCDNRPDIYYLILDGYGRADVLDEVYGYDNREFLHALEQKGFYVADESHSNYTQTIFSLSSSLNFDFIGSEPQGMSGHEYFTGLITNNHLMELLEGCGYQTLAFESGFSFSNEVHADVYLTDGGPLNEFESLLLAGTPLEAAALAVDQKPPEHSYPGHRQRVLFTFNELRRLARQPGPKFVFAHIISPHPPFVFDARGRPIEPSSSYAIADGDDYTGSVEEYQAGYAGQVQFVNQMILKTVDAILARSSQPPVIILQGDHGPGSSLDWHSPDLTCLWERSSILNAYFLPESSASGLYPSVSPVNSFRIVLNTYFGADLELLPDKTYFTSHWLPRQIIDITDRRESLDHCVLP